jgi:hypothetical protein
MKEVWKEAYAVLKIAVKDMVWYYNQYQQNILKIKVEGKVWLSTKNFRTNQPSKKLDYK